MFWCWVTLALTCQAEHVVAGCVSALLRGSGCCRLCCSWNIVLGFLFVDSQPWNPFCQLHSVKDKFQWKKIWSQTCVSATQTQVVDRIPCLGYVKGAKLCKMIKHTKKISSLRECPKMLSFVYVWWYKYVLFYQWNIVAQFWRQIYLYRIQHIGVPYTINII